MARDYISAKKSAQGYRAPSQRDGCRNCRHRSADGWRYETGSMVYDCTLGRFFVVPGGICNHHQPAGIASLPASPELPT